MSEAVGREVALDVLALQPDVGRYLEEHGPAAIRTTLLEELEARDPELLATRKERSWTEYCWTVTPAFCAQMVESAPAGSVVAWLDSDIAFLRDPAELLACMGEGSVLLVPHSYYRQYPYSAPVSLLTENWGTYNGGTIAFRNDEQGLAAVRRWRRLSIDWCFDRVEVGRFGNQKHLTDFAQRYSSTRVMAVPGGSLGPWNAGQFELWRGRDGVVLAGGKPVLSYHFQSLRLLRLPWWLRPLPRPFSLMRLPTRSGGLVACTTPRYRLRRPERRLFWHPYLRALAVAVEEVDAHEGIVLELDSLRVSEVVDDLYYKARRTKNRIGYTLLQVARRLRLVPKPSTSVRSEPQPERGQP